MCGGSSSCSSGTDRYLAVDDPDPYRRRHLVQTAAQISIDLANHVIAADGHRVPRDYGDAFRVLAEVGVLDAELAGRMVALAGARDLIVHLYAEVDDAQAGPGGPRRRPRRPERLRPADRGTAPTVRPDP